MVINVGCDGTVLWTGLAVEADFLAITFVVEFNAFLNELVLAIRVDDLAVLGLG